MPENIETSTYTLKAARKKRLYEEIVSQIQHLIETGELRSGDRLPPERKLAEMFMVSRNSVREAIKALEEKQILKCRPGDGTYVMVENEAALIEPLAYAIQLEKAKLREIFQFRRMIEPQIAYLAAENATSLTLAENGVEGTTDQDRLDNVQEVRVERDAQKPVVAPAAHLVADVEDRLGGLHAVGVDVPDAATPLPHEHPPIRGEGHADRLVPAAADRLQGEAGGQSPRRHRQPAAGEDASEPQEPAPRFGARVAPGVDRSHRFPRAVKRPRAAILPETVSDLCPAIGDS